MLVHGDYEGLEKLTNGKRLYATEIRDGVNDYGRTLVMPPDSTFDKLNIVRVEGITPAKWDVRVDLWTQEEGRSDLTLELTLKDNDNELYDVQLDNIHVL